MDTQIRDRAGVILSPNYPQNYGNNVSCFLVLETPEDLTARTDIVVNDFNLESCCDKLYYWDGRGETLPHEISSPTQGETLTSKILKSV